MIVYTFIWNIIWFFIFLKFPTKSSLARGFWPRDWSRMVLVVSRWIVLLKISFHNDLREANCYVRISLWKPVSTLHLLFFLLFFFLSDLSVVIRKSWVLVSRLSLIPDPERRRRWKWLFSQAEKQKDSLESFSIIKYYRQGVLASALFYRVKSCFFLFCTLKICTNVLILDENQ